MLCLPVHCFQLKARCKFSSTTFLTFLSLFLFFLLPPYSFFFFFDNMAWPLFNDLSYPLGFSVLLGLTIFLLL